jgi:hypothetical protein
MGMDELGSLVLLMVRLNRRLWVQNKSYAAALSAILAWHELGNPPTRAQVEQAIADGEKTAKETSDPEFAELEQTLLDGHDYRRALRAYLDSHK